MQLLYNLMSTMNNNMNNMKDNFDKRFDMQDKKFDLLDKRIYNQDKLIQDGFGYFRDNVLTRDHIKDLVDISARKDSLVIPVMLMDSYFIDSVCVKDIIGTNAPNDYHVGDWDSYDD